MTTFLAPGHQTKTKLTPQNSNELHRNPFYKLGITKVIQKTCGFVPLVVPLTPAEFSKQSIFSEPVNTRSSSYMLDEFSLCPKGHITSE